MGSIYPANAPIASHCIDGIITYSGCSGGDCHPYLCLTADSGPHWLVISVTGYSVDKIVVYNRIDGSDYMIQSSINGADLIYSNDFEGNSVIYQSSFGYTSSLVYTFDFNAIPKTTTYVRIQNNKRIDLTEVSLYYNDVQVPLSG